MSSCYSEEVDDCETVCETSISESCVHNRYYNDGIDFDDEAPNEYVSIGSMTFNQWEKCEKKRCEMLNEAKEKAFQTEKTMKWWADCTALWRKKWSIVRSERNAARNTIDKLMSNLHEVQGDTLKYFEAKVEAEQEIQRLKSQVQELRQKLGDNEFAKKEELKKACKV